VVAAGGDGTAGLVPNQVMLPIGPGTSTALMRALVSGPTPWLAPAVSTAIPTGTKLVVDSAPITDGIVQVDLSAQAATAIDKEAQALSAQVVWTLRQLVDVTAVRITVNGVPLDEPYLYPGDRATPSLVVFNVRVPQGRLWVMGDHRSESADSRFHLGDPGGGFVPIADVVGRAFARVWPLGRAGWLKQPATFRQARLLRRGS